MHEEWHAVWFTLQIAALSTLCILPPGVALAWLLSRTSWRGKSFVETVICLPIVMPPVATGLILLKLVGRNGPVGALIHDWFGTDIVFTWRAVLLATTVMSFPLLVRAARIGFDQISEEHEEAARIEGASPFQVFWHVGLPLSIRAVAGGLVLAYARALGEFGATILIAGNIPGRTTTIAVSIYQHIQLGQDAVALRLLGISVVLAFAAIWGSDLLLRSGSGLRKIRRGSEAG